MHFCCLLITGSLNFVLFDFYIFIFFYVIHKSQHLFLYLLACKWSLYYTDFCWTIIYLCSFLSFVVWTSSPNYTCWRIYYELQLPGSSASTHVTWLSRILMRPICAQASTLFKSAGLLGSLCVVSIQGCFWALCILCLVELSHVSSSRVMWVHVTSSLVM